MLYIKMMNDKYYLTTAEGYILHSENNLDSMITFCKNEFAATYTKGMIKIERS